MKAKPNKKINLDQVAYFQAAQNYCFLVWPDGNKILKARTLKVFAPKLEAKGWCRIHRSYLVNPDFVKQISSDRDHICMLGGIKLPISRRLKKHVLEWRNHAQ
jgi:two-component system, LytTR family, response regulator